MTNFTVLTDEQAAHDAATSKRYLAALREVQSKIADLEATEEGAKIAFGDVVDQKHALIKRCKSLEASITAMRDIISTQAARIAALEADAARLKFLVQYLVDYEGEPGDADCSLLDAKTPHEFIKAIDAAMQAKP